MLASALLLLLLSAVASLPLTQLKQQLSPQSRLRALGGADEGSIPPFDEPVRYPLSSQQEVLQQQVDAEVQQQKAKSALPDPSFADMKRLAFILANITTQLESEPAGALSTASQEMGWLLSRNVPRLMQELLQEYPVLRKDKGMMGGYMFVMDFLETVTAETSKVVSRQQGTLRELLEAAQGGEARLRTALSKLRRDGALGADFLVYLDAELSSAAGGGGAEKLLSTLKLLVVEEMGAEQGEDAVMIGKLAAEEDPERVKQEARSYFSRYDAGGKALLQQTLQLMRRDMRARYATLDPLFEENFGLIQKVLEQMLDEDDAASSSESSSESSSRSSASAYGSVMVDASGSLSTVVVSGRDRARFLQGLCTASLEGAAAGDVLSCAFLSAQARALHYCRAVVAEEEVTLLCDAADAPALVLHLQKYIFPADQVQLRLEEAPARRVLLLLCGEAGRQELQAHFCGQLVGEGGLVDASPAAAPAAGRKWRQPRVLLARPRLLALEGSGFESVPGVAPEGEAPSTGFLACGATFIVDGDNAAALAALRSSPGGAHGFVADPSAAALLLELSRLAAGKPSFAREQGPAVNSSVLELGLVHSVHFTKGCYAGQEVVAKTAAMNAVRRRLCVLQTLTAYGAAAGDKVVDLDGEEVGLVTSAPPPGPAAGLGDARLEHLLQQLGGYTSTRCMALVKTKLSSAGTQLRVLRSSGAALDVVVEDAPYCRFSADISAPAPPIAVRASAAKKALAGGGDGGAEQSEEERRRADKLRAMAEKVEAAKRARGAKAG